MTTDGQQYLDELAGFPAGTFERRFSTILTRLCLSQRLNRAALVWLFEASFAADLCNIAMNGLGGCLGILPEREPNRIMLERTFMAARARLYDSPAWRMLSEFTRESVERIFLTVLVNEENLAK